MANNPPEQPRLHEGREFPLRIRRATEMTETEFVHDPIHRVAAALSNVWTKHIAVPIEFETALSSYLQYELLRLTDEEMRARYQHFCRPGVYERAEEIADEIEPFVHAHFEGREKADV